jgi:hypothetical protein
MGWSSTTTITRTGATVTVGPESCEGIQSSTSVPLPGRLSMVVRIPVGSVTDPIVRVGCEATVE